jgi:repressor LexA
MPRRTNPYHVQLTVRERDTLLAHVNPAGALDAIFVNAHVVGPLVNLELRAEQVDEVLEHLNARACGAQNESAMDLLGQTVVRLEAGFNGTTDPGWHMLRPAMVRLDLTRRQGQFLAFIHLYTRLHRRPPAHSDIQTYFQTSPPVVNDTLKALRLKGFISTQSREARSIRVLVPPHAIPELE